MASDMMCVPSFDAVSLAVLQGDLAVKRAEGDDAGAGNVDEHIDATSIH